MVLSYLLEEDLYTPEKYFMTKQCKQTKLLQGALSVKINGKLIKTTSPSGQIKDGKMGNFCLCVVQSLFSRKEMLFHFSLSQIFGFSFTLKYSYHTKKS